jgi:mRNA-degrading endonuclease RelE of RelBE toxin-antitoxin system
VAAPRRVPGKAVKTIRGVDDSFHRLRIGDYRVMYDVLAEDRVVLILGIVHRGELERWLRRR